jgi:hypothetical protein
MWPGKFQIPKGQIPNKFQKQNYKFHNRSTASEFVVIYADK